LQARVCFSFQLVAAKQLEQACHAALRLYGESRGQLTPFPQMYPPAGELTAARLNNEASEGDVRRQERRVTLISRRLSANAKDLDRDGVGQPRRFTTLFVHAAMEIDGDDNTAVLDMLEVDEVAGK
jgi:hypothetical protein